MQLQAESTPSSGVIPHADAPSNASQADTGAAALPRAMQEQHSAIYLTVGNAAPPAHRQPPMKKHKKSNHGNEDIASDAKPLTKESVEIGSGADSPKRTDVASAASQPATIAEHVLVLPPEIQHINRSLTRAINESRCIFTEEAFRAKEAMTVYKDWRRKKDLPDLSKQQEAKVYEVMQGLMALYHPDIDAFWFSKACPKREEAAYRAFCEESVPLERLGEVMKVTQRRAMHFLTNAIRERQEAGNTWTHAQRYLDELDSWLRDQRGTTGSR